MITAKFLETYPLYRKIKFDEILPETINELTLPPIHLECPQCQRRTTFRGKLEYGVREHEQSQNYGRIPGMMIPGAIRQLDYLCASCNDFYQVYTLYFAEDRSYAMKVGQYPSWSISVDKNLAILLADDEGLYKKGLTCESQGYGIGAYAYYRRIVERKIGKLLAQIDDLLSGEDKIKYEEALKTVREDTIAKEKISLVKDLLPPALRPNNINPLAVLYESLSEGIHAASDDECLEAAQDIRQVLLYLVEQIALDEQAKGSSHGFTESMKKLLDKKSSKGNQ